MSKKVLVIAYYFPPMAFSGVQRTTKFVKNMVYFDWQPTVLTIQPKSYYAFDTYLLEKLNQLNVRIIRTKSPDPTQRIFDQSKIRSDFIRKILNRISQTIFLPDNKISWMRPALKEARKLLQKESFDIIYATAPPYTSFLIANQLKKEFDIPIILDYRDAWLDDVLSFYPTFIHRWIVKQMEKKVLYNSDKIITYTRQIKEHLLKNYKFLSPNEIVIIPHGFDREDFDLKFKSNKPFRKMRITYSGIFYDERTPKFFIEAVRRLFYEKPELQNKIEFCFVGNFPKSQKKKIAKLKLLNAFNFIGYVDHQTSFQYLLDSDALWLMIRHSKNPHLVATGKLFEYMGTGKFILACVPENGAAAQILKKYKAYLIVEPEDVDGIKKAIYNIYEMYVSGELPAGDINYIELFESKKLTQDLITIFQFQMRNET